MNGKLTEQPLKASTTALHGASPPSGSPNLTPKTDDFTTSRQEAAFAIQTRPDLVISATSAGLTCWPIEIESGKSRVTEQERYSDCFVAVLVTWSSPTSSSWVGMALGH